MGARCARMTGELVRNRRDDLMKQNHIGAGITALKLPLRGAAGHGNLQERS